MSTALRWLRLLCAAALITLTTAFTVVTTADARVSHTHRHLTHTHRRGGRTHLRTHRIHVRIINGRLQTCPRTVKNPLERLPERSRRTNRSRSHRRQLRRHHAIRSTSDIRARCGSSTGSPVSSPAGGSSTGTGSSTGSGSSGGSPSTGTGSTGSSTTGQSDLAMGSGGSGWDGYGGDSVPGANWRPYSDSSPFNQTVAGASVVPNSQTYVDDALQWGDPANMATTANTNMDYSHPTYYAQPSDPTYTLEQTGSWSGSIQGQQIQIPSYARPADGGDAHMTVVEPNGWEYDFWQVHSMANGVLSYTAGGRTMITGNGLDSGATAAMFGNLAGMIRAPELAAGHIDHALFIVLKCTSASNDTSFGNGTQASPASSGNGSYVYPAAAGGAPCPNGESSVPLGTRFMLDMTPSQIQALSVPTYEKTVLTALATYGGYVGDTGGAGFDFMFESSMTYTQLGLPDPLATFGAQNGLPNYNGEFVYNMSNGVNWQQYLKVITPPAAA